MSEKVLIGCKLPSGLVLEVGYSVVEGSGRDTRTMLSRADNYARVTLNGWNKGRPAGALAQLRPQHGQTEVDVDFWERWKKEHRDSKRWLKSQILFEAKNQAEFDAHAIDLRMRLSGLEPRDPDAMPNGIEKIEKEDRAA